ncbi:hypothetical protein BST96_08310 [Oceanicoccus sagamiensis]|uniref:PEP-CTERM protein-sorting domain-containing protein n=2 Tax=Oceanicoccus sagamiensis TaxID=716816 RepID=A0A1X9NAP0_9GAMM|nr:hypothetical protein BST96_08310 [Oceanicoccus sagamiensis]
MKDLDACSSFLTRGVATAFSLLAFSAPLSADYFSYSFGAEDTVLSEGYEFAWDTAISNSTLIIDVIGINKGEEELLFNEEWEIKIKSPDSDIPVDQGIGYHNDDGWSIQVKQRELDYELYQGNNEFTITSLSLNEESVFVSYYFVDDSSADNDEVYGSLCVGDTCGAGPTVVPVPAAAWLFGSALVGLVGIGRRK